MFGARFGVRRTWTVFVVVGFIAVALRTPHNWTAPVFYAEDGIIFFEQQMVYGFHSILMVYAGYLHLIPRLTAMFSSAAPVVYQPLIYSLLATLIQTMAVSFFLLPQNRAIVRSDGLRLTVCVLALLDTDGNEALANVMFAQWYVLPVALLILAHCATRKQPFSSRLIAAYSVLMFVIGLTAPLLLLFVPIAFSVLIWRSRGWEKLVPLALIVTVVIQGFVFSRAAAKSIERPPAENWLVHLLLPFVGTVGAWIYRDVVGIMLGETASKFVAARDGEFAALVFFCAILSGCYYFWKRYGRARSLWLVSMLAVSLGLVATSLLVRNLLPYIGDLTHYSFFDAGARYFYISGWLTLVIAALIVDSVLENQREITRVSAMLLLFCCGVWSNYPVPGLPDRNWPASARRIEDWKQRRQRHQPTSALVVPVNPEPWKIQLPGD